MSDATRTGATGGEGVAVDETDRLIASDKVEGTAVYNRAGESLGSVYTVMIDKYSGQVAYAVMSFGGFLGIGERYHPLPWKALTYDTRLGGYVVDVTPRAARARAELRPRRDALGRARLRPQRLTTTTGWPTLTAAFEPRCSVGERPQEKARHRCMSSRWNAAGGRLWPGGGRSSRRPPEHKAAFHRCLSIGGRCLEAGRATLARLWR